MGRKLRSWIILAAFLFILTPGVCSTAVSGQDSKREGDGIPTGQTKAVCNLEFNITDNSGGEITYFTVVLEDISLGNKESYTLTGKNKWNAGKGFPITANTTYTLTFDIKEGYEVVNTDGSKNGRFAATETGYVASWTIKKASSTIPETNSMDEESTVGEGDQIFNDFLEETQCLKEPGYGKGLSVLGSPSNNAAWIEENGYFTNEEWQALSDYDRMCHYRLFFIFCISSDSGDYDRYFADTNTVKNYFLSNISTLNITQKFPEGVYDAFEKIVLWQYQYFLDNGRFYNFMGNLVSTEDKLGGMEVVDEGGRIEVVPEKGDGKPGSREESPVKTPSPKKQAADKIKSNGITIGILAVFLVVLGIFCIRNRITNRKERMDY